MKHFENFTELLKFDGYDIFEINSWQETTKNCIVWNLNNSKISQVSLTNKINKVEYSYSISIWSDNKKEIQKISLEIISRLQNYYNVNFSNLVISGVRELENGSYLIVITFETINHMGLINEE